MYEIKKATIIIDLEEYADNLWKFPGQIDCSSVNREPSRVVSVDDYDEFESAEANIDSTVYVTIDDSNVVLEYEYISGEETVYIEDCEYCGEMYPCDDTFFSKKCYEAIMKDLSFGDKAVKKAKELYAESNAEYSDDDEVYVWSWFNSEGLRQVRIDFRNHYPEGVLARVGDLANIDEWWENDWNGRP